MPTPICSLLLCEGYLCVMVEVVVLRKVLTKRHYVLRIVEVTRVKLTKTS